MRRGAAFAAIAASCVHAGAVVGSGTTSWPTSASTDSVPRSGASVVPSGLLMRGSVRPGPGLRGELKTRVHHLKRPALLAEDPFHHDPRPEAEAPDRAPSH